MAFRRKRRKGGGPGEGPGGGWRGQVAFSPDGAAYVPGVVLVHREDFGGAVEEILKDWEREEYETETTYLKFRAPQGDDAPGTAARLRDEGIRAQVDHVLFATALGGAAVIGGPLHGSPLHGSPLHGSPLHGSPLHGSPLHGSPLHGSAMSIPAIRETGNRRSTAIPARQREFPPPKSTAKRGIRIAIVDTGFPSATEIPGGWLTGTPTPALSPSSPPDDPDPRGNGYLDPYAGHGYFIAGIIEQLAPGCHFEFHRVLSAQGHGAESVVANLLEVMAQHQDRPDIVNLSFAGYVEAGANGIGKMDVLAAAVQKLRKQGTLVVAAAGNDQQWAPAFPAALEGVIGVAALDEWGYPAPFTNYGPWVRACAVGVNLVSFFYDNFIDQDWKFFGYQGSHFETGWARWTGTSFAAPQVVARLANEMAKGAPPKKAVEIVLGSADDKFRYPNFGTVVTAFEGP